MFLLFQYLYWFHFCVCFMLPDSTVPVLILVPFLCVFYVTRFYCSSTYTGSIFVCVLCYQILLFQYLYWFHFCVCFMLPDSTVPVLILVPFLCVFYVTRFYCSSTYTGSIFVCVLCYQILLFQYLYWFHFFVCFMLPDSTVPVLILVPFLCVFYVTRFYCSSTTSTTSSMLSCYAERSIVQSYLTTICSYKKFIL